MEGEGGRMYGPADQGLEISRSTNNNNTTSSSSNQRSSSRGNNEQSSSNRRSGNNRSSNSNVLRQPQQTRHTRRLYIGHLPADLSEQETYIIYFVIVSCPPRFIFRKRKRESSRERRSNIQCLY